MTCKPLYENKSNDADLCRGTIGRVSYVPLSSIKRAIIDADAIKCVLSPLSSGKMIGEVVSTLVQ